jgi:hypothetical protein
MTPPTSSSTSFGDCSFCTINPAANTICVNFETVTNADCSDCDYFNQDFILTRGVCAVDFCGSPECMWGTDCGPELNTITCAGTRYDISLNYFPSGTAFPGTGFSISVSGWYISIVKCGFSGFANEQMYGPLETWDCNSSQTLPLLGTTTGEDGFCNWPDSATIKINSCSSSSSSS